MADGDESLSDAMLDPELRPIVAEQRLRTVARPALEAVDPAEMRRRAAAEFAPWNDSPEPIEEVRDFAAAGVAVRLYRHEPKSRAGLLVYLHGGGWVIGDLELEDTPLRHLARRSRVPILSIDYRLAPEHPFPAALEDAGRVFGWVRDNAASLEIDRARIGVGGASAGANLALGAALRLRDRGLHPAFLLLLYGAYSGGAETASYRAFGDGRFGLARPAMDWFWRTYAGPDDGERHPQAVPLHAELAGLPPAFLNYAELDLLRDDSVLLAERLRSARVPIEAHGYPGAIHGFTQFAKRSALARRALDTAGDALRAALG